MPVTVQFPVRPSLAGLMCVVLLGGCFFDTSSRPLPPEWHAAMQPPRGSERDPAGTYRNLGMNCGLKEINGSAVLAEAFFDRSELPRRVTEVELKPTGRNEWEAIARDRSSVVARKKVSMSRDPVTGEIVLPRRSASLTTRPFLAALPGATSIRLCKGSDGCLYARFTTNRAGLVIAFVPVGQADHGYVRWMPATPRAP